jgi:ABC-type transport system involved in Fe-S cluster assembly fused permease/ATPase subunit
MNHQTNKQARAVNVLLINYRVEIIFAVNTDIYISEHYERQISSYQQAALKASALLNVPIGNVKHNTGV